MSSLHTPSTRGGDRASRLGHALVRDVMHPGITNCGPETDLLTVARTLANGHIHALVVSGVEHGARGEHLMWGLLTSLDLVAAALPGGEGLHAGDIARTDVVTVDAGEPVERAATLMIEHRLTHLLVVSGAVPVGVVSTLDVAQWLAEDRA